MNLPDKDTLFTLSGKEANDNDPLEALVRQGARLMLQAALEAEVNDYLQRQPHQRQNPEGDFHGYRNGTAKERTITVGSGAIKVKVPRVSDVPASQEPFASQIIKPYQRRSQSLTAVFPNLFIEGLATRDFEPALRSLRGQEAALSPQRSRASTPNSKGSMTTAW